MLTAAHDACMRCVLHTGDAAAHACMHIYAAMHALYVRMHTAPNECTASDEKHRLSCEFAPKATNLGPDNRALWPSCIHDDRRGCGGKWFGCTQQGRIQTMCIWPIEVGVPVFGTKGTRTYLFLVGTLLVFGTGSQITGFGTSHGTLRSVGCSRFEKRKRAETLAGRGATARVGQSRVLGEVVSPHDPHGQRSVRPLIGSIGRQAVISEGAVFR